MPTQLLSIGSTTVLTQNAVYALPAKPSVVTTSAACDTSINGSTWTAFTSGGTTTAKFIRSTLVGTTVSVGAAVAGAGGGGSLPADAAITSSIAVGTNPAQSGAIRLANNQAISSRNAANNADVELLKLDNTNIALIPAVAFLGGATFGNGQITITNTASFQGTYTFALDKRTAPAGNPPAQRVWIWAEDNAGKCKLMCKFATGSAIQISAEV